VSECKQTNKQTNADENTISLAVINVYIRASFRDQSSVLTEVKNKQSDVNVASGRRVPSDAGCTLLCPKQPAVVRLIRPTPVVVYFCLSLSRRASVCC